MSESDHARAHDGGCLCGAIRFRAAAPPLRTTICHCTFCQRATGSAYLVEPIFAAADVTFQFAPPRVYDHRSAGSGKRVTVSFCGACGTHLALTFERFPGFVGIFAGAFDDPNWFDRGPGAVRHIFTRHAQTGVVLPAGVHTHPDHWMDLDGAPLPSRVFASAHVVGGD